MKRFGFEMFFKMDFEQFKEVIKVEICKQFKLKEGVENLKKVVIDRKIIV